ncbi:MAG: T9SS type B sorting domain-containing protein [Ferruginibacter sp.]
MGIADQTQLIVQESGTYHALLFDDNCPLPFPTNSYSVQVDFPTPGIRYPEVEAAINFPVQLESRTISNDITWSPATSLDDAHSSRPYFRGIDPQLYTIRMVTPSGCETVDTQYVKTVKKIAIYVPTMFTPNGDGRNDFLRPLLLGFRKINYFRVYNRWGKLLFESQNDLPGWNGILQDAEQGPQSLVWVIEAVDIDGKTHFRRGTTILMR